MGYIDIHSHVLPHMDDGAKDMDEALKMLRIASREGITDMFVTPHYKSGRFAADSGRILRKLQELQQEADWEGIPITLYPGNEIYYHSELEEKLETGSLCTMNDSGYVLVEFSPGDRYLYIRNAVEDVLGMGYVPILAHVERYQCLCKDMDCVEELRVIGCRIQVNADSVTGAAGFRVKHLVNQLLKHGYVDYIGTDAHSAAGRKPAMEKCAAYLYKKFDRSYADALLFGNAERDLIRL